MRIAATICVVVLLGSCGPLLAQEPPPPIPRFVVDLHSAVLNFPDDPTLALSRGVSLAELPGLGLGGDVAAHIYPLKLRAVTFGFGGRLVTIRAHRTPPATQTQTPPFRPVTERFTYLGPELSFNFGTGSGWSYISGGIAAATWSVSPEGAPPVPANDERLQTIDYGGGARWFAKPHLAFSLDVRFYAINPSTPAVGLPGGPRTTLFVFGAGVSLK